MKQIQTYITLVLIVIIAFLFTQCNPQTCERRCVPSFFEKIDNQDTSELKSIFKLSAGNLFNQKCGYVHELKFWYGTVVNDKPVSYLKWNGRLFNIDDIVYFELDSGNTIKYFDFSMPLDQPESIQIVRFVERFDQKVKLTKQYNLVLEEKFYDESFQDTICKFRFGKLGVMTNDDDLVFYIGRHAGLKGIYAGGVIDEKTEEVLSYKGMIYMQRKGKYAKKIVTGQLL